jgi:hypothetical protein
MKTDWKWEPVMCLDGMIRILHQDYVAMNRDVKSGQHAELPHLTDIDGHAVNQQGGTMKVESFTELHSKNCEYFNSLPMWSHIIVGILNIIIFGIIFYYGINY